MTPVVLAIINIIEATLNSFSVLIPSIVLHQLIANLISPKCKKTLHFGDNCLHSLDIDYVNFACIFSPPYIILRPSYTYSQFVLNAR